MGYFIYFFHRPDFFPPCTLPNKFLKKYFKYIKYVKGIAKTVQCATLKHHYAAQKENLKNKSMQALRLLHIL